VPTGSRARRLSLGTLVALTVGPAPSLGEATAAQRQRPLGPPTPGTTAENTLLLEAGSTGQQVRKLQSALHIKVDGIYGPETEAAVYEYQGTHGLHVDGIVGRATSGAIAKDAHADKPSGSDAVALVQAAVGVGVDGEYGPETYEAIRAFQAAHHLNVDGVVGPQTWRALHLDEGQKLVPPPSALARPEPQPMLAAAAGEGGSEAPQVASTEAVGHTAVVGDPSEGATPEAGSPPQEGATEAPPAANNATPEGGASAGTDEGGATGGAQEGGAANTVTSAGGGTSGGGESTSESTSAPGASSGGEAAGSGEGSSGEGQAGTSGEGSGTVRRVVGAANEIANRPYVYGGGHGSFQSEGYDCSGSVSYALHGGGLMKSPETSGEMESYGEAGPGKHITIYANAEHAYMEVNGRRYDTVALAEHGSRWSNSSGSDGGSFVERHPSGY
jgi:peptidoglycan hydrolase-like protein with peptidoglycan-binding domain